MTHEIIISVVLSRPPNGGEGVVQPHTPHVCEISDGGMIPHTPHPTVEGGILMGGTTPHTPRLCLPPTWGAPLVIRT